DVNKLRRFNKQVTVLLKDHSRHELKRIAGGTSFSRTFKDETLATLDEVLELCPKDILLNIEIKNIPVIYEGIEQKVIACLQEHDRLEQIMISSFEHVALYKTQQLKHDLPLGMLFYYRIHKPW